MVNKKFRETEINFAQLRKQFFRGEISREQFADSLKKLRLVDDQGKCWMIGAQSGKWYYYDGQVWRQSDPPADQEDLVLCPECHYYNQSGTRICEHCGAVISFTPAQIVCRACGQLIDSSLKVCPF
ncbi:MAG: double zinc ribbon domain-containing protein, partial [Candidatus Saccharicenans sp.]